MELKGRFNSKLLKKAKFSNAHFSSIEENNWITGAVCGPSEPADA
jgi:hypothetical protein